MGQKAPDGGDGDTPLPGADAVPLPLLAPLPLPLLLPLANRISDSTSWSTYLTAVSGNEGSSGGGGISRVAAAITSEAEGGSSGVARLVSPPVIHGPRVPPGATALSGPDGSRNGSCDIEDATLMGAMDSTLLDSPPDSPRVSSTAGPSSIPLGEAPKGRPSAAAKSPARSAGVVPTRSAAESPTRSSAVRPDPISPALLSDGIWSSPSDEYCSLPIRALRGRLAKAVSLPLLTHMAAARYDGVQCRTAVTYSSVPHSAAARYRSTSISGGSSSPLSSPTPLSPLRPRRAGTYSGTDSPSTLQGRPRSPSSAVPKVLHPQQLQLPPLPGITRQDELLLMTSLRSMSDAMSTAASSSRASSGGGHHHEAIIATIGAMSTAASSSLSSSAGGHRDAAAAVSSSRASSGGGHRDSITAAVEASAPPPAYRDDPYPVSEEEDEGEGCTDTVTPAATAAAHGGSDIGVRVPVAKPPTTVAAEAESSQLAVGVSAEAMSTLFTLSASVDALTTFVSELTTAVGGVSGQLAGVQPPQQMRQRPQLVWMMAEGSGGGDRNSTEEGGAPAAAAMAAWPSSFASIDAAALAALRFSEYEDSGGSGGFLDAAATAASPSSDPAMLSLALSLDAGMPTLRPRLPPQRARRRRTGGDGPASPPLLSRSNDAGGGGSSSGGQVVSAASGRRRAEALLRRHPLLGQAVAQALCVTVAGLVGGTLAHASLAPEPNGSRLTRLE